MTRVAQRYGLTGSGLAKVSDGLGIPYPPRGYLTKSRLAGRCNNFRFQFPPADQTFPQFFHLFTSETERCALPAVRGTGGKDPRAYHCCRPRT